MALHGALRLPHTHCGLAHAETLPVAQVVDQPAGTLQRQRFEGQQVRPSQIADVYVIAYAGAIACRIVGAENVHVFGAAEGDLQNPRDEMGLRLVRFPLVGTGRTGGIEISQAGIA